MVKGKKEGWREERRNRGRETATVYKVYMLDTYTHCAFMAVHIRVIIICLYDPCPLRLQYDTHCY